MGRSRIQLCAVLIGLAAFTSASYLPSQLVERTSGCSNSADTPCNQGLPPNFCCQSGTVCLALAGNTTALCCPSGQSCKNIRPVSCDISLQNATAHPENALLTTDLSGKLPVCGSKCCPFGYTCSSDTTICVEDPNQDLAPGGTASTSLPSTTSTSSVFSTAPTASTAPASTPTSSTPSTSNTASEVSPTAAPECTKTTSISHASTFSPSAILVGFFPGLVAGILLSIAYFCFLGSRRGHKRISSVSSSFGGFGANVSEPIYNSSTAVRTDFLRKPQNQVDGVNNDSESLGSRDRTPTLKRMASFVRKSMNLGGGYLGSGSSPNGTGPPYPNTNLMTSIPRRAPIPPPPPTQPKFPRLQTQSQSQPKPKPQPHRAESGVSINIFAASDISPPLHPHHLNIVKEQFAEQQGQGSLRESHQTSLGDFVNGYYGGGAGLGEKEGEARGMEAGGGGLGKGTRGRDLVGRKDEMAI